jgi:hypothetical protein
MTELFIEFDTTLVLANYTSRNEGILFCDVLLRLHEKEQGMGPASLCLRD